ncbi:DUF2312 domain-containing protein [Mesorhizobium sp. M0139]|uniref:DUF2312 domain-containing protein n=1 Tax=Mesorhizobium sp. M0139 TaxID=2956892 RepID=UPI00333DF63B
MESATIGHNSIAGKELTAIIERIERFEVAKKDIADEIKNEFTQAKGKGFDVKIMRKVIRMRKMDQAKREEEQALTEAYLHACGML